MAKEYLNLDGLSRLLDNLKSLFATKQDVDTKADIDHNHDTNYDIKGSAEEAIISAKNYTDNAVSQKSQVQFITWEVDD